MRVSIEKAADLTGKSKKTLYRHMKAGRLAYGLEHDNSRFLEVSELMRAYGALKGQFSNETPTNSQMTHTENSDLVAAIGELRRELAASRKVQEQQGQLIKELTDQLKEIKALPAPTPSSKPNQATSKKKKEKIINFNDLIKNHI